MRRARVFFPFAVVLFLTVSGCGNIEGLSLPYVASPRVEMQTPASPAEGNVTITFNLIDREVEPADITLEYSTNGGTTYSTATLTIPAEATNLASAWHPGKTHSVTWNSVTDMVGRSGAVSVCIKITPSDASNPSGTPGISGSFTVNNIAYNEAPTATAATPAGVQSGNVQINYFLSDVESDTCSIAVLYSTNGGTSYQAATMGAAGDGVSGLSSSPSGTAHVYLWDSRADNVAPSGQVDTIRIRITPTDFNAGTAGDTNSFSVDNSVANNPPTVAITGGPADGSTVTTTQVTFTWSGSDTDGSVVGYYYSFDHDPPDVWTTNTTVTSGALSEASHIFRVVAVDDDNDLSVVASRTFTVSTPGTITADFSGSPLSGTAPFTVNFTDLSTATNGIDTWSWDFGDSGSSTQEDPSHQYISAGSYTVSLTVTGPDGTDTETKTNYITATSPGGDTIYVDGVSGDDGRDGLSWATSVQTIQTGLDKASSGWTVLVANDTYTGTDNKNLDFAGKAIHLKSVGGAANCIIDCENDGCGFAFVGSETLDSIVDGFTIQNGNVDAGAGIYCNAASPTITSCIIRDNYASTYGAGICCDDGSNPTITNCTITNNSAGNAGGGINCWIDCSPTITNCAITSNSAQAGGGICCDNWSNPAANNCTIVNNLATEDGGGICCWDSSNPTVTNCTIANNSAGNNGAGIACYPSSQPTLNNTIIWSNIATTGNQVYTFDNSCNVTLSYCDCASGDGDVEGDGTVTEQGVCIHLDPTFVNATAQDYHLETGSPCIDVGDNSLIPPGVTTDLDGYPRIMNDTVDMGAYEYHVSPAAPSGFYGDSATADSITWHWTDNSSSETGFEVQDAVDMPVADTASNAESVVESGLEENTLYTRHCHSYNAVPGSEQDALAYPASFSTSAAFYTVGFQFMAENDITITKVKTYTGSVKATIWNESGGVLRIIDPAVGDSTWPSFDVTPPLALTSGQTYRIAVYANPYGYTPMTNVAWMPDITVLSSVYSSGDTFPSTTISATMYGMVNFVYTSESLDYSTPSNSDAVCTLIHDPADSNFEVINGGSINTVTTESGAQDSRGPLDIAFNYSRAQVIYLQSEIGCAGTITKISFYQTNSESTSINNCTINMYETTDTELSNWIGGDNGPGTEVFSGDLVTRSSAGWFEIDLATPFVYSNTDNLLISIRHQDGSFESTCPTWNCKDVGTNRRSWAYSDVTNPPAFGGVSILLPRIQMDIVTPGSGAHIDISAPPNPTTGLTGVRIERATDAAFTTDLTTVQNFLSNYSLNDDPGAGIFYYRIRFRNQDGVETADSPPKSIILP